MALKANRPGTRQQTVNGGNQMANEQVQEQSTVAVEETAPATTPAVQNTQAPAVNNNPNQMADINAGILDNIDDLNIGGNYVTMDGSEFLYKASEETAPTIDAVITYGKRFYQWYDEDNQKYHNSDTKLDDRYKMKFEIRWFEEVDGEPQEHIMTLPTSSAMSFINYVKGLAKQGIGVGQVVTRMSISRQHNKELNIRYSRTEFENVGSAV